MSQRKKQACVNSVKCMLNMIEYMNLFLPVVLYMFELRETFELRTAPFLHKVKNTGSSESHEEKDFF
jgi:hypothetical protein